MQKRQLPVSGRLLAIDYGRKRVGIAMSDALRITAQPHTTIQKFRNIPELISQIHLICSEFNVVGIILGLPRNMDGSEGEMAQEVIQFAQQLETKIDIPLIMLDERLTSVQAKKTLTQFGIKPSQNKHKVDQMAAALILRGYLDSVS